MLSNKGDAAQDDLAPSTSSHESTSRAVSKVKLEKSVVICADILQTDDTERHPDLWFSDGSVVLLAQKILFRVHMSILSRHSIFFRDMFSLPQPSTTPPSYPTTFPTCRGDFDGCPLVHLHDTAEDLASLLNALYDGPKFGNNDREDFRVVSGILRLATKYLIDSLRNRALEHLSIAWPSTLKAWDAREEVAGEYYVDSDEQRFHPSPVHVINLAREVNVPSLLPSAFYDLSRYSFNALLDANNAATAALDVSALSLADTQKLALGKEFAQLAVPSLIRSMATETQPYLAHMQSYPLPAQPRHPQGRGQVRGGGPAAAAAPTQLRHRRAGSCTSAAACRRDVSELVDLATQHYLFDHERGACDPLYVAEELGLLKSAEMEGADCKACGRALEVWAARERERLWRAIPGWFRLETP